MSTTGRIQQLTRVVIVGGSLAGSTAASRLRGLGYEGHIVVIDDDARAPYDRPPLSKRLLGDEPLDARAYWASSDAERIRGRASSFSAATRTVRVETEDGTFDMPGDVVIIASGARARRLPFEPPGVFTLRSADDAIALRAQVQSGARSAVIIGAGAIGTELASVFRDNGLDVTIVDAVELPLIRLLGREFAERAAAWITDSGTRLVMNAGVAGIEHGEHDWTVSLASGEAITADLVVSAVGAAPRVDWLADSGVLLENGVRCDSAGRVLGLDGEVLAGIFAIGDVAARSDGDGGFSRSEAWDYAQRQGNDVAATILGQEFDPRPLFDYFWTDQFARKVQVLGNPSLGDGVETVLEREARNAGVYRIVRGDDTVAWITVNSPREFGELARTGALASLETPSPIGSAG
jgi:3-phenylpropionate/trans-cinnamate dioxygenase ferredoxin reductase subunit